MDAIREVSVVAKSALAAPLLQVVRLATGLRDPHVSPELRVVSTSTHFKEDA